MKKNNCRSTKEFIITLGIFGAILFFPGPGSADTPLRVPVPQLAKLIEEGLTQNKEIRSMESRIESLKAQVSYAGSLSDPKLGFALLNLPTDSFNFEDQAMTQKQLFISQKFPWFGKLDLKSQTVALQAIREEALLRAKQLEIARKIASEYYELGIVAKSREINKKLIHMMKQNLKVADSKYATGRGLQQDVFQAQVELSKLMDEKIGLDKKYRVSEDRINAILNREKFVGITPPDNLEPIKVEFQLEELQSQALKKNPWIKVKQTMVDITRVKTDLAKKEYYPDMDVKVAYGQRDSDKQGNDRPDFVSAAVVVNLPLWQKSRQNKKVVSQKADHQAAIESYEYLVRSLPFRIDALITEIKDTIKSYEFVKDTLIFQTRQWAGSSHADYRVGKVEFNTMIKAQTRLLKFELQAEKYLFNIYKKYSELEEILGGPFVEQSETVSLNMRSE